MWALTPTTIKDNDPSSYRIISALRDQICRYWDIQIKKLEKNVDIASLFGYIMSEGGEEKLFMARLDSNCPKLFIFLPF